MRHTHREIEEAKMLGRRLARLRAASVPPLSRLRTAVVLLTRAVVLSTGMKLRAAWMWWNDLTVCPHCHGAKQSMAHVVHDEFQMRACRLCKAKGVIGAEQRASVRWGRALLNYRLGRRHSLAFMQSCIGTPAEVISDCENGLVPLDDWPYPLYNIVDVHIGRTEPLTAVPR